MLDHHAKLRSEYNTERQKWYGYIQSCNTPYVCKGVALAYLFFDPRTSPEEWGSKG